MERRAAAGRRRQAAGDERVHGTHHMVREQQAEDVLGGAEGVIAPADRFPEDALLERLTAPRPHEPGSDRVLLIELHRAQVFGRHRIRRYGGVPTTIVAMQRTPPHRYGERFHSGVTPLSHSPADHTSSCCTLHPSSTLPTPV